MECLFVPAAHQVKFSFTRLRNARGHASFERFSAGTVREFFNVDVDLWRDRSAINEELSARVHEQVIAGCCENCSHCVIVCHDGENHVRRRSNFRQILRSRAAKFGRERYSGCAISIVNSRYVKLPIF